MKRCQRCGRKREFALAQRDHGFFVLPFFFGIGQKFLAVDGYFLRLQFAHALVDALLNVLLLALQLGHVAGQVFIEPAQLGVLGAQHFELAVEIEQAALDLADLLQQLGIQLGLAGALRLVALLQFLAQVEDRLARFVVVEQAGLSRRRKHGGDQDCDAQPAW